MICIFRNNLSNIRPTVYDFFVIVEYMYKVTPQAARMLLGPGTNATMRRENYLEIKHLQFSGYNSRAPISNVETKNIGLSRSAGFT